MQVNVHAAKTRLSELIDAALAGEEVVIARGSEPVMRLVPVPPRSGGVLGLLKDRLSREGVPGFLEPMDERDLRLREGRRDETDEISPGG